MPTTAAVNTTASGSGDSPSSGTANRIDRKGCRSCVWLTRSAPPMASARYQAKKPIHIENMPTYTNAAQATGATGCAGQVSQVPGSVTGRASTVTQQITRSAPRAGVTCAP